MFLVDIKVSGACLPMELADVLLQDLKCAFVGSLAGVPSAASLALLLVSGLRGPAPWLSCDFMGKMWLCVRQLVKTSVVFCFGKYLFIKLTFFQLSSTNQVVSR